MIIYFTDRQLSILGLASTGNIGLQNGISIVDDDTVTDVETGTTTLSVDISFTDSSRIKAAAMAEAGNYLLVNDGTDEYKFYTIIDETITLKDREIQIYAEDGGMDFLNEVAYAFIAEAAHTIDWYIERFTADSGFEIRINEVENSDQALTLGWTDSSTITARLASIAASFGVELSFSFAVEGLKVTHKYINIFQKRGSDNGAHLRVGYEIDNLRITKSVANLATALDAVGGVDNSSADLSGRTVILMGSDFARGTGSESDTDDPNKEVQGWPASFQSATNCNGVLLQQDGGDFAVKGGQKAVYPGKNYAEALTKLGEDTAEENRLNVEYIIVGGGMNDMSSSKNPGGDTAIRAGIDDFVTACATFFPYAKVYVFPLIYSPYSATVNSDFKVTGSRGYTLQLDLAEEEVDEEKKTSVVSYSLKLISSTHAFTRFVIGWTVTIDGNNVSEQPRAGGKYQTIGKHSTLVLASGKTTIKHNDNGSKVITASASIDMATTTPKGAVVAPGPMSIPEGTMTLTNIGHESPVHYPDNFDIIRECYGRYTTLRGLVGNEYSAYWFIGASDYGAEDTVHLNNDGLRLMGQSIAKVLQGWSGNLADDINGSHNNYVTLEGYDYDDGDFYVDGRLLKSRKAASKWGRFINSSDVYSTSSHLVRPFDYNTNDVNELFGQALEELKRICDAEVGYEADLNYLPEGVSVGDTVYIVDTVGELYLQTRILTVEYSESRNTHRVVFGEFKRTGSGISDLVRQLAEDYKDIASRRTFYTWTVYADDPSGTNMSLTRLTSSRYLGIANNKLEPDPDLTNASLYKWTALEGGDDIILKVSSSGGTYFYDTTVITTLTAFVYVNGELQTDSQVAEIGVIRWYKDDVFTGTTGKQLSITAMDLVDEGVYEARLED